MKEYVLELVGRYRSRGIIIDSNLLVCILFGFQFPDRIHRYKVFTSHFVPEDLARLSEILKTVQRFVVTSHILTEVSNLLTQAGDEEAYAVRAYITANPSRFDVIEIPIADLAGPSGNYFELHKYGLTDAGIIHLVRQGYLVLSIDGRMCSYLNSLGLENLNYMHASCLNISEHNW